MERTSLCILNNSQINYGKNNQILSHRIFSPTSIHVPLTKQIMYNQNMAKRIYEQFLMFYSQQQEPKKKFNFFIKNSYLLTLDQLRTMLVQKPDHVLWRPRTSQIIVSFYDITYDLLKCNNLELMITYGLNDSSEFFFLPVLKIPVPLNCSE